MEEYKQKYRVHCKVEPSIPIFSKDWWLDAVCGEDNWDVVLVKKGERVIASMPYCTVKRRMMRIIIMPRLTQTMGPWIKCPPNQKYSKKIAFEKKIFTELINKIPKHASFNQNFHYSITNWLPFYWHGFKQTTRYTYVIALIDLDRIFADFSREKRRNIKKAKDIVEIRNDLSPEQFYQNHVLTLSKQGAKILYSFELFFKIYNACHINHACKIFYAVDKYENLHSAIFTISDNQSAYNLISTIDPAFRNSGSASLLVWEALKYYNGKTKRFDFEGSMIEGVENSFRAFGAQQMPYFQVSKINSLFITMYRDIRSWGRILQKLIKNRARTNSSANAS